MRTRAERRKFRVKAMKHGERLRKELGEPGGILFDKHNAKISRSLGYFAKGSVSHYVCVGPSKKVRDKNRYGKSENWSPSDIRKIQSGLDSFDEE